MGQYQSGLQLWLHHMCTRSSVEIDAVLKPLTAKALL